MRATVGGGVVRAYPAVLSEQETLARVIAGASLSRFGDGELRQAAHAVNIKPQVADAALTRRLRDILIDSGECLVGIPNILARGPKDPHWKTYEHYASYLSDRVYGSAFISRPDSAPWIDTDEYWQQLESLWVGQDVTLVRGAQKSLTKEFLVERGAGAVHEVLCTPQNAWSDYERIMAEVGRPARALLCLGPTATVMAVDLCAKGVHAIDLGHVGMFFKKKLRGDDATVRTDADKVLA